MANLKASKIDIKKIKRNTEKNKKYKTELKTLSKIARKSVEAKEETSLDKVKKAVSRIDSAVSKGIIHRNTASRKKSRLMAVFNKGK